MHGNQWVLKIAVLKYYSVSKRGTTAKSNPKQATDPISLHTKFGDNSSNTFPLNERKPCVTPDIGRRTPDIGHRTAKKAKIIYPPPRGVDIIKTVNFACYRNTIDGVAERPVYIRWRDCAKDSDWRTCVTGSDWSNQRRTSQMWDGRVQND